MCELRSLKVATRTDDAGLESLAERDECGNGLREVSLAPQRDLSRLTLKKSVPDPVMMYTVEKRAR